MRIAGKVFSRKSVPKKGEKHMFGNKALRMEIESLKANQAKIPGLLRVAFQIAGIPLASVKEKMNAFIQNKRQSAADAQTKIAELTILMREDTADADQAVEAILALFGPDAK